MDNEELDLLGNTTIEEEEEVVERTSTEEAEEVEEEEKAPEENAPDEESEEEEKPAEPTKDSKTQALTAERARRKAAERELKELKSKLEAEKNKEDDKKAFEEKRDSIRKKLLEKDVMDEEVADTILEALGDDLIKTQIESERRKKDYDFDKELSELKKDELFMDADAYKPQIKELMEKGLTMKQAYMASLSEPRLMQIKKDMEVELEQKLLNNEEKADRIDVGHAEEKGAIKKGKYTKREQEIAKETGLTVEEVHKRYMKPSEIFSIDDLVNL